MTTYTFRRTRCGAYVFSDNKPIESGAGLPEQSAFAILKDYRDELFARQNCKDFQMEVIDKLSHEAWSLTSEEVQKWVDNRGNPGS